MTTDDRRSQPLPVTNEIGSEGGSYGDPTMQVNTFQEPQKDAREPGIGGAGSAAAYAIRRDDIVASEEGRPEGIVRYPTEAPDSPSRRPSWAGPGLVGAAAGFAIGMIAARRR